jgi:hypothetical protein
MTYPVGLMALDALAGNSKLCAPSSFEITIDHFDACGVQVGTAICRFFQLFQWRNPHVFITLDTERGFTDRIVDLAALEWDFERSVLSASYSLTADRPLTKRIKEDFGIDFVSGQTIVVDFFEDAPQVRNSTFAVFSDQGIQTLLLSKMAYEFALKTPSLPSPDM